MSLYADYLTERTNKHILETNDGFAVYSFTNDAVYIEEIFVSKEGRQNGAASKMADQIALIAQIKGLNKMLGSVCPSAKNSTISLKVLLGYGFKLDSATNDFIVFSKELNNG